MDEAPGQEPEVDFDNTIQIEAVADETEYDEGQWNRRRPRFKTKEIIEDEDGRKAVIFRTLKTTRRGERALARRIYYRVEKRRMDLEESNFVELHLFKLLDFEPTPGEDRIHLLNRRSWWEHGPWQLGIIFGYLLSLAFLIFIVMSAELPSSLVIILLVLGTVVTLIAYFIVWMRWAYEYQLITNKRIGLFYKPPFGLVGKGPMSFLNKLTLNEANDQSWFANLIGKINPAFSYGMLNLDTNAQEDEWMRELKFVREHTAVRELIARLTADAEMIEVRETDEQISSRELQDMANRRYLELHGDSQ
ncbi:MAG: hypothetical protein ABIR46_01780 [Candidatus Saccharimonadales bacterium]